MNASVTTIGNATLIVRDGARVILATDPWMGAGDDAYFGSWGLNHVIPEELARDIYDSQFVWFSHGHPDHMNPKSLPRFKGKQILLADHVGGRLVSDLRGMGYDVTVLADRKWVPLSDNVRVLSIATFIQDSVLLVDLNGRLFVNLNDAGTRGCARFVRQIASAYEHSYLLMLSGWGDVDMVNIHDDSGRFIQTIFPGSFQVGAYLSTMAKSLNIGNVIPFSSFHLYQRADSIWAETYLTSMNAYSEGFRDDVTYIPPFSTVDCRDGAINTHDVVVPPRVVHPPEYFGDNWTDELDTEDRQTLRRYFATKEKVQQAFGFITFRVGNRDTVLPMRGQAARGITFAVPRASLMAAVRYHIFDDLLIGNFMKTTFHGNVKSLYDPNFNFWVTKYADNGLAESRAEVAAYLREYRQRAGSDYYRSLIGERMAVLARERLRPLRNTPLYAAAKRLSYRGLR